MASPQTPPTHPLSKRSTAAIPDSIFHATDFILGAGAVIIQPSTSKIVLVTDERKRWFLPKGRKDKGESLEQTVLREAYEEVFLYPFAPPSRVLMSKLTGTSSYRRPLLIASYARRVTCVGPRDDRPGIGSSFCLCIQVASHLTPGFLGMRYP